MVEGIAQPGGHCAQRINNRCRKVDQKHRQLCWNASAFSELAIGELEFSGFLKEKKNEAKADLKEKGYNVLRMKEHAYSASLFNFAVNCFWSYK